MINKTFFRQWVLIATFLITGSCEVWAQLWNPQHSVGTLTGNYHFKINQVPDQLVELLPAGVPVSGQTFQWEISSSPLTGFVPIGAPQGTQSSYTFTAALTQTTYLRRKTTNIFSQSIYSNTVKLHLVSANWEDHNYVREHSVQTTGITTWQAVDALTIGQKQQSTIYIDNLGRPTQEVQREAATSAAGLWGDVVKIYSYDGFGRQPQKYLPYTTTTESGKYKTNAVTAQATYFTNQYNESSPYSLLSFDNSPLNRLTNTKAPGTSWAASIGKSVSYDMNTAADDIKRWDVDYVQGNPPVLSGTYSANSLLKNTYTDENNKEIIEFTDNAGRIILKKVQVDNTPAGAYTGWMCFYYVYDDFGQIRFEIQPEGVKYLAANSWSFAGANGIAVLNEQVIQYNYDDKKQMIWKKTPGEQPSRMLYDIRDRLVFAQDGNQAALATPQWNGILYDELDRPVISIVYNTTKSLSTLQSDINNAAAATQVTVANPANNGGATVVVNTTYNPVLTSDLNNPLVALVVDFIFYDNYNFPGVKTFNSSYTNTTAYSTSDPNVVPIATSNRIAGRETGGRTRILGSNSFLVSTAYFDQRGSTIQILTDNVKSGTDITTFQHHFAGRLLSTCVDHTTAGTGYTNYKILTKYLYDQLGRITSTQKQFGSNAIKTVVSYEYDDIGRVKTKKLDPGYTAGGNPDLESLNYTYNLHNRLTGINKDYALKSPATYNKWQHFFGMYIGYDNRDNVFTSARLNEQITGVLWNTQGDDAQRRYNYSYDNVNRLIKAAYTEQMHPGDGWITTKTDFSVSGTSGNVTYDLNGNLLTMLHKGVIPGNSAPVTVDDLQYTYASYSNKLQSVTDQMTLTAMNGKSGDFKDGVNGGADYVYDNNGNVIVDLNKGVEALNGGAPGTRGVSYNYLNKPELIRIAGKGTIRIVYSATGEKLQRAFIPEAGGPSVITTYIDDFVYQESATITTTTTAPLGGTPSLSFIKFGEGRIRVITPLSQSNGYDALNISGNISLPNGQSGVYDYFITDYQQNVRMVLTEETHVASNTATMETGRSALEEPVFGQPGGGNEVSGTRYPKPGGWTDASLGSSVSRLGNIAGKNLGPNVLQKVMAGDKVNAEVKYYHQSTTGGSNPNLPATVLGNLLQSIGGSSTATDLVKSNASGITSQLNGTPAFINAVTPGGAGGTTPQAFLTILFFDERFNFIEAADGGLVQTQVAATVTSAGAPLQLFNVKAPKNGYVYAYVSNRSDQDVYFDNFYVNITRGNIIEENHYYSFGLKIAAISSSKPGHVNEGHVKNNYQYQGGFSEMDADIAWVDFEMRNYDPQIGRWVQRDPYGEFASAYTGMGNDPVNLIDPSGGSIFEGLTVAGRLTVTTFLGAFVGGVAEAIMGGDSWKGVGIGAAVGLGAGLASLGTQVAATLGVNSVNLAVKVIATPVNVSTTVPPTMEAAAVHGPNVGAMDMMEVTETYQQGWQPLDKKTLENYYKQRNPGLSDGQIQNLVGNRFEEAWNIVARRLLANDNYQPNTTPMTGGTRTTVPDGTATGRIGRSVSVPRAAWFEVKAKLGDIYNSTSTGQTLGHITNLAAQVPRRYRFYGWRNSTAASLTFVTTSDVSIAASVIATASVQNILIYQYKAEYMMTPGGFMTVRFRLSARNGLTFGGQTTTPVVLR